jgi:hypothetical protein
LLLVALVCYQLALEDGRGVFDIHEYGYMVLHGAGGALGETMHQPVSFANIMQDTPKYMVSRQFAAMLQVMFV